MEYLKSEFYSRIQENPIIAAVNDLSKLDKAIESPCEIIFLLQGSIINLEHVVHKVKSSGKMVFVHLDLMDGLSRDVFALKYIHEKIKPDGIISTKPNLIRAAKDMHIFTIKRLFILDSLSLQSGMNTVNNVRPDALEILPGVMNKITKRLRKQLNVPIITGGLICDKEDVIESLKAGAMAVSTSNEQVWYM
ncbi:glycerol-3-phosphate responsive antiterminator [Haloimpatiens sp. FM7330]|uniref:glycerol-3-phosphate responsive antiterminator n=1 Tax=Haloimpatiens sp. FM7330 TaxID=3298610 RepID=UPI003642EA43